MSMHFRRAGALVATVAVTAMVGTALTPSATAAPAAPAASASAALPGTGQTLNILVLGDSYSAGNGSSNNASDASYYGPKDCYRNKTNWGEQYAAGLRSQGYTVNFSNHACSGGVAQDFANPRQMETQTKSQPAPPGVTTNAQGDSYLATADPCNTHQFPDEEFWTYHTTSVSGGTLNYTCTRNLRPQADFVTQQTDLVLFTNGGNDAKFSTIVTDCFVPALRSAESCKSTVDGARALLPMIKQGLLVGVAAIRAHGLRNDAKIVQLGYPWLQLDNNFTLPSTALPPGPSYAAGNEVRSLVTDGDAQIATVADDANIGHAGQMAFLAGVPEYFSGHEPDATTPVGNLDRWINQVGDGGATTSFYYHPNAQGQAAYARMLLARGTWGAPTHVASTPPPTSTSPRFRVHLVRKHVRHGHAVVVRTRVFFPHRTRPRGKVFVRVDQRRHVRTAKRVLRKHHGRATVRVRGLRRGVHTLTVTYRGPGNAVATRTVTVRVR